MNLDKLRPHAGMVGSLVVIILLAIFSGFYTGRAEAAARSLLHESERRQTEFSEILPKYRALAQKMQLYMDQGVDTALVQEKRTLIRQYILAFDYDSAETLITEADTILETKLAEKQSAETAAAEATRLAEEALKGTLNGKVTANNAAISGAVIKLTLNGSTAGESSTDREGTYSLKVKEGTYVMIVSRSGYNTFTNNRVTIKAQQTTTQDVNLTVRTATPPVSSSSSQSVDGATYEKKSVNTSRGTFAVDMITIDVTKVRMVTDTAADNDCSDNCPTKSLASYVSNNGGFAGINGTYFCPTDYSECAGKSNTFHWKILTTRLNKIINENNGLAENDPAIAWGGGQIKWYGTYNGFKSSGFGASAMINSRPRLVETGNNVLNNGDMDDKQRTVKSNRGGIGLTGNTLYAVIARSATVPDLAEIMRAVGAQYAMNIDGGGSSALYFGGGYKVGPGRSLPNAVIFAQR